MAGKLLAGAVSSEGLTGARGTASRLAPSPGWWLRAVPHPAGLSAALLRTPSGTAIDFPRGGEGEAAVPSVTHSQMTRHHSVTAWWERVRVPLSKGSSVRGLWAYFQVTRDFHLTGGQYTVT